MSSISPSSSASNEALPLNVCSLDAVAACLAQIRLMAENGTLSAADASSMVKQVFPAYHAGLRRCGSTTSGSELSEQKVGGRSAGSSAVSRRSRYFALSKLKTWRSGQRDGSVATRASGYCYRDILSEQGRAKVDDIGPDPTVYTLLGMDSRDFLPLQELRQASIVGDAQAAHVSFTGHGTNLCDELAAVAQRSVPAFRSDFTLWHSLQGLSDGRRSKYSGLTTVGALDDLCLTPQGTYVSGARVWKAQLGKTKIKLDMRSLYGAKPVGEHCLAWLLRDLTACPAVFDCLQLVDEYSCYFSSTVQASEQQFRSMCDQLYERGFIPRLVQGQYAEYEWDYGLVPGRPSGYQLALAVLPILGNTGVGSVDELMTPGLLRDLEVVSRRWTYSSFAYRFDQLVELGKGEAKVAASATLSACERDCALLNVQSLELLTRKFAIKTDLSGRVGGEGLLTSVRGGLSLLAILGVVGTRVGRDAVGVIMRDLKLFD